MRRRVWIALLLFLIPMSAAAQSVDYFPDGVFGVPRVHSFVEGWYSRHLRVMGEPSLHAMRGRGRHVVRFLKLPTWGVPVAIRVENRGGTVTLVRRQLSGQGGYDPGSLNSDETRTLSQADWRGIEGAVRRAGAWSAPTRTDFMGMDGEQWVVELLDGERYHVLDRWTPEQDPSASSYVALCQVLEHLARPSNH